MTIAGVMIIGILAAAQSAGFDAVLEKLDAYLDRYETELSAVVADEKLIQETEGRMYRLMNQRLPKLGSRACLPASSGATYTNFRRFQTSARIVPQP